MAAIELLVLDTHVAVWWSALPDRLSQRAAEAIGAAVSLVIPSIVFWEVALLVGKKKLELDLPVRSWAERIMAIPRVRTAPLTPELAVAADGLAMHSDPADRFIVATAISERAKLVSKDRLLGSLAFVEVVW